mgnify:CR=1 FL=1
MKLKKKIPLAVVKPLCITGVLAGILFFACGRWAAALCCLLGAYGFERNLYCCPNCGRRLNMKYPLMHGACCPECRTVLRQ